MRRLLNSFAYRSSAAYRFVLRRWPPPAPATSQRCDVTYLTFAGRAHLELLRESVSSLAQAWPRLPTLRVVTDGTAQPEAVRRQLRFWPDGFEVVQWRDLIPRFVRAEHAPILAFAERVPMARKLVAVAATALDGPTLYGDADVLWYRMPRRHVLEPRTGARLAMSTDMKAAYDERVVPSLLPELARPPYYCAGVLFAQGDFLAACDLAALLDFAAREGVALTEQTILAEANRQLGGDCWPLDDVAMLEGDRFSLLPSFRGKPWTARHYIGQVRHIFWRDALALRFAAPGGKASRVKAP